MIRNHILDSELVNLFLAMSRGGRSEQLSYRDSDHWQLHDAGRGGPAAAEELRGPGPAAGSGPGMMPRDSEHHDVT
jgi:hypothetical protein